jgi:hypothetical protein
MVDPKRQRNENGTFMLEKRQRIILLISCFLVQVSLEKLVQTHIYFPVFSGSQKHKHMKELLI